MLPILWLALSISPTSIASEALTQRTTHASDRTVKTRDILDDVTWPERWQEMQGSVPVADDDHHRATRREGLALFAQGRLAFQRERYPSALMSYQRALRHLGPAPELIQPIMGLAVSMGRSSVAAQYALLLEKIQPDDIPLVRYLAMHLTDQDDYVGATQLFDLVLQELGKTSRRGTFVLTHFEYGRLAFALGDRQRSSSSLAIVEEAIRNPEKYSLDAEILTMLTDEPEVTFTFMGEAFLEDNKLSLAEQMFRRAYAGDPDKPALDFHLARIYARRHDDAQMIAALKKYFLSNDESAGMGPYQLLSEFTERQKGDASASVLEKLERLQERDSQNIPLAIYCADRMVDAEKWDEATLLYRQVLKQKPVAEAFQGLARIALKQHDVNSLLATIADLVEHRGDLADLGPVYKQLLKNKSIIEEMLQLSQSESSSSDRRDVHLALGLLTLAAEMPTAALELSDKIVQSAKVPTRLGWALELLLAAQYDEAIQVLQAAEKLEMSDQQRATLRYHLSGALAMAKKTDEALSVIQKAIREKPDSLTYLEREAWIHYHADRLPEAEAAYLGLIERFDDDYESDNVRSTLHEVRMSLSNLCVERGDNAEAERWLEEVLDEFPADVGAMNDLGYLWADQGKNVHRALEMVERAATEDPSNIAYQDSWGWTLHSLGRHDEARQHLEKAAAGDDPDPVILDHLAEVLSALGQPDVAQQLWQRAIESLAKIEEKTRSEQRLEQRLKSKLVLRRDE